MRVYRERARHHSFSAEYDANQPVNVQGAVVAISKFAPPLALDKVAKYTSSDLLPGGLG